MTWWMLAAWLVFAPNDVLRIDTTYVRFGGTGRAVMNPEVLIVSRGETAEGRWLAIHCGDLGYLWGGGCALVEIDKTRAQGDWLRVKREGEP